LGGDGTLLHVNSLFQNSCVPPLIPISMGTLGFLTPFYFENYQKDLPELVQANRPLHVTARSRLLCTVHRFNKDTASPIFSFKVLNELGIHSSSSVIVTLELVVDNEHITTIEADGLIVSTPTGSTAYSMSAGGPMTAPHLPGILVTPICPHTLNFRPLVLPSCSKLRISMSSCSRSGGKASFDARHQIQLQQNDYVEICSSEDIVATLGVCSSTSEWFHSITNKLHWNVRQHSPNLKTQTRSQPPRIQARL